MARHPDPRRSIPPRQFHGDRTDKAAGRPQLNLRFECRPGCTKCCEQQGFVYLTEEDIRRLADYLKMSPPDFESRYVFRSKNLRRLKVPRDAQCWFLESGGCRVHEAKPLQCRTFPYWPELMESRKAWHETAKWCPGIGKGELVQIEAAESAANEMRQGHPHLYR